MAKSNIGVDIYNNFSDFIKSLNKPNNEAMQGRNCSTEVSPERTKFTKTSSIEEAYNLLSNGYIEPLEKLKKGLHDFKIIKSDKRQHKPVADIIGYVPIVPHVINGIPQNMINYKQIVNKTKTVSILYDAGIPARIPADAIIANSVKLLSLLNDLEVRGYKAELRVSFFSYKDGKYIAPIIKLKEYKTPLNLAKLSFPLIHPSMSRRLFFRWVETCAHTTRAFRIDYGSACTKNIKECNTLKELLQEKGVIKKTDILISFFQLMDNSYKSIIKEYK